MISQGIKYFCFARMPKPRRKSVLLLFEQKNHDDGIWFSRELRARSSAALTVHRTVIHYRAPSSPTILINKKGTTARVVPLLLVRTTGQLNNESRRRHSNEVCRVANVRHNRSQAREWVLRPHQPHKAKNRAARTLLFCLVRMTGFEPTRISSLEPETSASAVPPHPLIQLKIESGKLKVIWKIL